MNAIRSLAIILVSLLLASCAESPTRLTGNTSVPKFVAQKAGNKRVLVFVHGIFGDALDTWKNSKGKYFFDFVSADTEVFDNTDIFVFGFDSEAFSGGYNIDQAATNMEQRLHNAQLIEKYDQLIFVTHSMGGLVTQRFLLNYPQYAKKTPLVFFFATPQEGSAIANIATKLLNNPALENLIPMDGGNSNTYLITLDQQWKIFQASAADGTPKPVIRCAYENKDTKIGLIGLRVVPYASATRSCVGDPVAIGEDHINIVKPLGPDADAYIALRNAVRDIPKSMSNKSVGDKNGLSTISGTKTDEKFVNWPNLAKIGNLEDIKYAVEGGAPINKTTTDGQVALHFAAKSNQLEIVKYLLSKKADLNVVDHENKTPLFMAVQNGSIDIVNELANAGCNIDQAADVGSGLFVLYKASPVAIASMEGYKKIVELLLANGADVNPVEREERFLTTIIYSRPLRMALEKQHYDIAMLLLQKNASPKKGDLLLALESRDQHLIQRMLEKGADPTEKGEDGQTVEQLAENMKLPDVVKLLKGWSPTK